MTKKEIPADEWQAFAKEFNKHNSDKIVKVEVTDDEDYRINYAESLPFRELSISRLPDNTSIMISAGTSNSFRHTIDNASRIVLNEEHNNARILSIESALGRRVVIRFHPLDNDEDLK